MGRQRFYRVTLLLEKTNQNKTLGLSFKRRCQTCKITVMIQVFNWLIKMGGRHTSRNYLLTPINTKTPSVSCILFLECYRTVFFLLSKDVKILCSLILWVYFFSFFPKFLESCGIIWKGRGLPLFEDLLF